MKQIISARTSVLFLKTVFILAATALPVSLARAEAVSPVVYGETNESLCSISGDLSENAEYLLTHGIVRTDFDRYCRSLNFLAQLSPICRFDPNAQFNENEWIENLRKQTCNDHFYMYIGSSFLCNRWRLETGSEERVECEYFLHTQTVGMIFMRDLATENFQLYSDGMDALHQEQVNFLRKMLDETFDKWITEEKKWVASGEAIVEERDQYYELAVQFKNQNEKLVEEANSIISQYRRELSHSRDTINELAKRLADTQSRSLAEERQRKSLALMSLGLAIAGGGRFPSSFSKPSSSMHSSTAASARQYSLALIDLGARIASGQPMFGSPPQSSGSKTTTVSKGIDFGTMTPTSLRTPGGLRTCKYRVGSGEAYHTIPVSQLCPIRMKFGSRTGYIKHY